MKYLSKICKNLYLYLYPCALSDGLSCFHMIGIFFGSFLVILNWHHRRFTCKFLKDEEDQNCCSKTPTLSRRGTVLALLQMLCKCSLALSLKGGFSAPHKTKNKNKRRSRNLLAICYGTKSRSKPPCFFFPLECPTHQATEPFWSKFSLFSGTW